MNDRLFSLDDTEVKYPNDFYISCHEDGHQSAVFLSEASDDKYNAAMKKFLYRERIKNDKVRLLRYKNIKEQYPEIKFAFLRPEQYKGQNLILDLSYYHTIFMRNNIYKEGDRGIKMYFDFLCRIFDAKEIKDQGYTRFTIFVPIDKTMIGLEHPETAVDIFDYKTTINIFSTIIRMLKINPVKLKEEFSKYEFIFIGKKGYFTVDFNTFELKDQFRFMTNINTLLDPTAVIMDEPDEDGKKDSPKAILHTVVDKIEDAQNVHIDDLRGKDIKSEPSTAPYISTGRDTAVKAKDTPTHNVTSPAAPVAVDAAKGAVVDNIKNAIKRSGANTADDVIDIMDKDSVSNGDNYIANIIATLADEENDHVKTSSVRNARLDSLRKDFNDKEVNGIRLKDVIEKPVGDKPIEPAPIKVDSINKEEWENMQFNNFNKSYDVDSDIMSIIGCFNDPRKSVRVGALDVTVEDTSTSEDYIKTYNVKMEDEFGKRFTLKFDVPKLINNRFMRLRGNQKVVSGQLVLLPVIKTDLDTVQMVSNYNKVFIRRYGSVPGKSFIDADRLIKTLTKKSFEGITITLGNNSLVCNKYELPIDYMDLAAVFTTIETPDLIIHFDQEAMEKLYKIDRTRGIPYGYDKISKEVIYFDYATQEAISTRIIRNISYNNPKNGTSKYNGETVRQEILKCKPSNKYMYSKASILSNEVPVIVLLGYGLGLLKAMDLAGVKYGLSEKKRLDDETDWIKFNDGYINFHNTSVSSMLMNGLKECDTEGYSLSDLNSKAMWLDFLDQFGGRILADGLDNFADLMVDPITAEVCHKYKIPDTYYEQLVYSNALLTDNKFNRHVDITGNRYRSNEIIAGYTYKVLAKAYGDYKTKMKRSRQEASMSVKQSAVIDAILLDPTASDLSILNPLLEIETANNVTFKGLSGMNSDRSYGLDKRTYDDSMVNLLALSTGFAANVGINRVATIDMNIEGTRGYIKQTTDTEDRSVTKTFSMTEALNPFGVTRDDPFRSAMTYIQTAKHGMTTKVAIPQFITNGADEALPYLSSDTFAFKAKQNGKITELVEDDHMILEYKDGTKEYVDLRERVMKNSDGGFYVTIKLKNKIGMGSSFKKDDIVAYFPKSFSPDVGPDDKKIAYNIGTMAKVAIMNTDEGFEDSTIVSDWVSEAMSSEVVVMKDCTLPKNTNLYFLVEKGQYVQEGDPLIVFQNAFDDKDINILLKNITDDDGTVSELGRIPIKSKVTGVIQDINIYRTVDKEELSDSLRKTVDKYEKDIVARKKLLKANGIDDTGFVEPAQTLEPTGKLKNAKDSVYIEIYIKYNDKLSVGDKIVATSAAKGVIKDIFPRGQEPTTDFRPNEPIHAMFANGSFNARMIASVLNQGAINKGIVELTRKVKDIMNIPYDDSTIY